MDLLDRDENGDLRPIQAIGDDIRSMGRLATSIREITQTPNVKYPEYESPALRKETFINLDCGHVTWPHDDSVADIDLLVNCGLFYTGRHDLVRCFQCGVGLKDWAKGDNPVLKHIRHSPNCEFANKTKDNNLLWKYQKHTAEAKASKPWRVRHSTYQARSDRLASFTMWPLNNPSPTQLAEAGFIFTGYSDACRCFSCDGGLRDWEPDSDPWLEHAKAYPNCQFVLRKKGEDYVYKIQSSDSHQTFIKQIDTCGGSSTWSNVDVSKTVRLAIELGFPKSEVDRALEICKIKGISTDVEHVMNILLDNQDQNGATNRQRTDVQMLTKNKHSEHADTESTATGVDVDEIRSENDALRELTKCKICMERQIDLVFLPCRHLEVCSVCGGTMTHCPTCQDAIVGKFKTSLS